MKTFIIFLLGFTLNAFAEVSLQDCLEDSRLYADSKTPVKPLSECAEIIEATPSSASVISPDKKWKAFGIGSMIYVDVLGPGESVLERILLAGEQTELVNVEKIFIDPEEKRLIVIQKKGVKNELMLFNINFLGNVSPLKVMRSPAFAGVTSAKFKGPEVIEVKAGEEVMSVRSDGESRQELSTKKDLEIIP